MEDESMLLSSRTNQKYFWNKEKKQKTIENLKKWQYFIVNLEGLTKYFVW